MTTRQQAQGSDEWRTQSYLIGHPLEQLGRWGEALVIYQNAIQRDPGDILVHLLAGTALLNLDREAEARTYFQQTLSLAEQTIREHPDDRRARVFYADALWMLDRADDALAAYDDAIRLAPDDPEAYVNKGWALFTLNRLHEARDLFEHAHRLRPDDVDILYRQSNVAWDAWDYPEALRLVEQAIALDATQPRFYSALATTLSYLGREEEARQAEEHYRQMVGDTA